MRVSRQARPSLGPRESLLPSVWFPKAVSVVKLILCDMCWGVFDGGVACRAPDKKECLAL